MCPDKVAVFQPTTPPLQRDRHIAYRYVVGRLVSTAIHCSADPLTRRLRTRLNSAPPRSGAQATNARPTDDDLIRTYDVTVAAWCNGSAKLGGCATVPGRPPAREDGRQPRPGMTLSDAAKLVTARALFVPQHLVLHDPSGFLPQLISQHRLQQQARTVLSNHVTEY